MAHVTPRPAEDVPVLYLTTAGNSTEEGGNLGTNKAFTRASGRLAAALGKSTETNVAVAGSALLTDLTKTWTPAAATGGWVTAWRTLGTLTRTRAPYMPQGQVGVLGHVINDVGMFGHVAGFLTAWAETMKAVVAKWRAGSIFEDSHASNTYSGSPAWSSTSIATINSGTTVKFATANGAYVDHAVASDYDGQAIWFAFLGVGTGLSGITVTGPLSATITVTKSGVQVAQHDNAAQCAGVDQGIVLPHLVRIPTPDPTVYAGQTLRATVTNLVGGNVYFDCVGYEANPAPLIILADGLRAPTYASLYVGWPHTPTDADITAVNAKAAEVCAFFGDGRVVQDGADAVINKTGTFLNVVHPDERMEATRAELRRHVVRANLSTADLTRLGMP